MIELYAAPTSNGLRALIMLEECGLPYRLNSIDLSKGEQRSRAYLAINPMGQIPAMVDPDGPGQKPIVLTQSLAIMMYLARKTGRFLPAHEEDAARFDDVTMSIATDLSVTFGAILLALKSADGGGETSAALGNRFTGYLSVWNEILSGQPYCFGDAITIADFALFSILIRDRQLETGYLNPSFKNLQEYLYRINSRDGVIRIVGAIDN